ncbi:MAG: PilZ domain-containing protein, partial [Leptospira sp.]|nr:PilZ domain-containing protein [Leptospira sp.]
NREYPAKVISLKENGLIITHNRHFQSDDRILTLSHNGTKILTSFKYLGGDDKGYEVLMPIKMILREAKREGNRINLEGNSNKLRVTMTLNQNEIHKAQGFDDDNVDRILTQFTSKLKTKFDHANIYYSPRLDNRLRLMQNYDKPIFIPNRKEPSSVPRDYFPFEEYIRLIQIVKLEERFISEISIPVKYKGYTPLGYVQVLGQNPLTNDSYESIQMVTSTITREIINTGIFQESKEVCEVSDLSSTGLSFLHPQSRFFSRSFSMGEIIIFELIYPNGEKSIIRAMIKNMKNMETNFRVGVEFYNLTVPDYKLLEKFLNSQANSQSENNNEE